MWIVEKGKAQCALRVWPMHYLDMYRELLCYLIREGELD